MKAARALALGLLVVCADCGGGGDTLTGTNPPTAEAPKEAPKKPVAKPAAAGGGAVVQVGLDVLDTENPPRLKGRKVGLVVNAASVTADARWAGDVLLKQGVEVVRLFVPEHGLVMRVADGAEIADSTHERTGLPIVSLYGKKKKPAPEDLDEVRLDENHRRELIAGIEFEVGLVLAREAVLAAMRAAAVGIERPLHERHALAAIEG